MAVLLVSFGASAAGLFSDKAVSSADFEVGKIDLDVDWEASRTTNNTTSSSSGDWDEDPMFNVTDIQPGDSGSASIDFEVENNPSWIWLRSEQTGNGENTVLESENGSVSTKKELSYEVNLVTGLPVREQKDSFYSDEGRLVKRLKGEIGGDSTETESPEQPECVIDTQDFEINGNTLTANFGIKDRDRCGTGTRVSLVSYKKKTSDWTDKQDGEVVYDYVTDRLHPEGDEVKELSVKLPEGHYLLENTNRQVFEDFESGNLDEYEYETDEYKVDDDEVWKGDYALESDNEETRGDYAKIFTKDKKISRGHTIEYYARSDVGTSDDGDGPATMFLFGLQDDDDFYAVRWLPHNNNFYLLKKEEGENTYFEDNQPAEEVEEDKWYRFEIQWKENGDIRVRMIDPETDEIKSTLTANDDTFTEGKVGFTTGVDDLSTNIYYDHVEKFDITKYPSGHATHEEVTVLEDFESGNLDEYEHDTEDFEVQDDEAFEGQYSLKNTEDWGELVSKNKQIQAGTKFRFRMKSNIGSDDDDFKTTGMFVFGFQDFDNSYNVRWRPHTDNIWLGKREDDEVTYLDKDTSVDGDFEPDKWYEFEVDWEEDGKMTVKMIDPETGQVKSTLEGHDDTFGGGKIGYTINNEEDHSEVYFDQVETVQEVKSVSNSTDNTTDEGELGQNLRFVLWYDDGDGEYESNEESPIFNGTAHQFGEFDIGDGLQLDGDTSENQINPFEPSDEKHLGFKWNLPENVSCNIQTDSKTFRIELIAQQLRHVAHPDVDDISGLQDTELTKDNYFQAGQFDKCVYEEPEPPVCGEIDFDGHEYTAEREEADGDTEHVDYDVEMKSSSRINLESQGEGLGDEEEATDTFRINTTGNTDYVEIKIKAGPREEYVRLEGVGDTGETDSGTFKLELKEIIQHSGKQEFVIEVEASDDDEKLYGLSHIVFEFCEELDEEDDNKYAQVDLVEGEPIEDLSETTYHEEHRMEAYYHFTNGVKVEENDPDQSECIEYKKEKIKHGEIEVKFKLDIDDHEECEVSLVSYKKDHPGWDASKAGNQEIYDSVTETFDEDDDGDHEEMEVEIYE